MRTANDIKQLITEKSEVLLAITKSCEDDKREQTAEEQAAFLAFHGDGTGENPGEYKTLVEDLRQAEVRETNMKNIAAMRMAPKLDDHRQQHDDGLNPNDLAGSSPRFRIPAKAKQHFELKAFKTPEDAYMSGQFLRAIACKDEQRTEAREWCSSHGIEIKMMTSGTNTDGGFLVPNPMEMAIIALQEQYGMVRRKFQPYPMSSDTDTAPSLLGGLTVYFPDEETDITTSDLTLGQEKLQAAAMATLTSVSRSLSEDSIISIVDLLAQQIARAFANTEDEQGFNGNGNAATYGGKVGINSALLAGSKYTAATGNTAFSTLDDLDFLRMIAKLPAYPGIMPEWYIHRSGYADSMGRLSMAGGGNTKDHFEGDMRPLYHGYPVNFVNVMNSTLTAQTSTDGLCYFGDLSMGAIHGTRMGTSIATDDSLYFASNRTAVRGWQRNAINVHSVGTASAAGAIIGLTTPGS